MTNSNLRTENHFDYVKISIASPQRIMDWGQRTLPNGQVVGEVTKPETTFVDDRNERLHAAGLLLKLYSI